jgi:hypothetical protein
MLIQAVVRKIRVVGYRPYHVFSIWIQFTRAQLQSSHVYNHQSLQADTVILEQIEDTPNQEPERVVVVGL